LLLLHAEKGGVGDKHGILTADFPVFEPKVCSAPGVRSGEHRPNAALTPSPALRSARSSKGRP